MDASAPPLDLLDCDEDETSVLKSTKFLKKIIDMEEKFRKIYEKEVEKEKAERMRKEEEKKEEYASYLRQMKATRDAEMSFLGTILKYIWMVCLFLHVVFFFNHYFQFMIFIEYQSLLSLHALITIPFVALSVMTMALFTDG